MNSQDKTRTELLAELAEVRASEARYHSLFGQALDMIHVVDAEGRIIDANAAELARLGYTRDEVVGRPLLDLVHPEHRAVVSEHLERVLAGKAVPRYESALVTKSGEKVDVAITTTPRLEGGRVVCARAIARDITGREAALRQLEEQESYFRSLMYSLHEDILVIDRDFRVTDVNNAALVTTGQTRDEVVGRFCYEVSHGYAAPCAQMGESCVLDEVFATGEAGSCHHIHRAVDGPEVHVDIRLSPLTDAEGRVTRVVEAARDVTEVVASRAEIDRSRGVESVLREILQAAAEVEDLASLVARIRHVLSTVLDTTNFFVALYEPESDTYLFPFFADQRDHLDLGRRHTLPHSLTDYVRRTGRPLLVDGARFAELQAAGETELVGTPAAVWMGAPLSTAERVIGVVGLQSYDDPALYGPEDLELLGSVAGTIAIAVARTRAAEALHDSEERLRSIVESSTNLFYSHTADHVLTYVSPQSRQILGCEPEEALVRWTEFATDNPVNDRGYELTQRAIDTGEPQPPYQLELRGKSGRTVWVEVREAPVVSGGRTVAIVGALTDITEELRLEQQLVQAQKMEALGQLAGGIAHDFNNLLMAILGSAELLGMQAPELVEGSQELATIRDTVERGAQLTRRLLTVARQQVLQMETLDLDRVVADELEILRRVIPESIEIDFRPAGGLPAVRADRGQLAQVLMNLVVNARDAMADGGAITIATGTAEWPPAAGVCERIDDGPSVRLSVSDTGAGMDAKTLARIFDPFFSTKAPEQGTGLGLATVYGIVRQHGGVIEADCTPGKGARFEVFLPPVAESAVEEDRDSDEREVVGGAETVLVVEDDAIVRRAVVRILESLGYTVLEATDGQAALALLEGAATVDLVLSDVVMPRMGGEELLDRARLVVPRLRFLFSSGYTDEGLRDTLQATEGTAFLAKPFTASRAAAAVRAALKSSE